MFLGKFNMFFSCRIVCSIKVAPNLDSFGVIVVNIPLTDQLIDAFKLSSGVTSGSRLMVKFITDFGCA